MNRLFMEARADYNKFSYLRNSHVIPSFRDEIRNHLGLQQQSTYLQQQLIDLQQQQTAYFQQQSTYLQQQLTHLQQQLTHL